MVWPSTAKGTPIGGWQWQVNEDVTKRFIIIPIRDLRKRGLANMKAYAVQMEIEGPFAMFRNPASGSALISYPMPPASAVAGMFSAVARLKTAVIVPKRVELCGR